MSPEQIAKVRVSREVLSQMLRAQLLPYANFSPAALAKKLKIRFDVLMTRKLFEALRDFAAIRFGEIAAIVDGRYQEVGRYFTKYTDR